MSARRSILIGVALLAWAGAPVLAQEGFAPRSGVTTLFGVGLGAQTESGVTDVGAAGLNLGIGAFVGERALLMLRASGTNVATADGRRTSGTVGIALGLWVLDRLRLDAGVGAGVAEALGSAGLELPTVDPKYRTGWGFMLGASYAVWRFDEHEISIGVEYAPALTSPHAIQNFAVLIGWQRL